MLFDRDRAGARRGHLGLCDRIRLARLCTFLMFSRIVYIATALPAENARGVVPGLSETATLG